MALGAGTGGVMALVLTRGLALVGAGVLIGVAGGLIGSRLIESVLFGIGTADPITYFGVSLSLVVVALVACVVPGLRAVRQDPAEVLKAE
jgi:ABC-type antimicrobial peptide transport system permease subunit